VRRQGEQTDGRKVKEGHVRYGWKVKEGHVSCAAVFYLRNDVEVYCDRFVVDCLRKKDGHTAKYAGEKGEKSRHDIHQPLLCPFFLCENAAGAALNALKEFLRVGFEQFACLRIVFVWVWDGTVGRNVLLDMTPVLLKGSPATVFLVYVVEHERAM
jgi:hypothetical protein